MNAGTTYVHAESLGGTQLAGNYTACINTEQQGGETAAQGWAVSTVQYTQRLLQRQLAGLLLTNLGVRDIDGAQGRVIGCGG